MTPEHWAKVRALLEEAMQLPAAERSAFLDAREPDAEIVAQAKRLLSFEQQASAAFSIETWQGRATRTAAEQDLSGIVIGNYRLLSELGRGGMGAVYLAERADGTYQQQVAVKILQENIYTDALAERFRQERQILARLTHPGIARLLDGGVLPDGRPYLVLEYVDGVPIDRYCSEQKLSLDQRLRLFVRVAEVVQSAHQQLILHLDLKPANILVTAAGEPRLLDFGLARILSEAENRTENTLRLLTPRYASPEQANGAPLGVASDVYSLATLLFRLLTGTLPHALEDATPLAAVRILNEAEPTTPSSLAPALKGDLDTILLQGLRKEPERRYPTVAAFGEDVQRHLDSRPVLAHSDDFRYRAGKFLRRNRVAAVVTALAAVIAIGSAVAVVRYAVVARRQRVEADAQRAKAVQRFNDLRALSHSYIFDIDPQLEPITGTTKVRAFVLKNALKYLDKMAAESEGDDDLAREVSQGYSAISLVQADSTMPSLSDRPGAMTSVRKALAIQQHIFDRNPSLLERGQLLRLMRVLGEQIVNQGDPEAAVSVLDQAWQLGQPIAAAGPKTPRYMYMPWIAWDRALCLIGNGNQWNLADPVNAAPWLDRADALLARVASERPEMAHTANLLSTQSTLASTHAEVLQQLGRDAEAEHYFRQAIQLTYQGKEEATLVRGRKVAEDQLAEWMMRNGRVAEAKAMALTMEVKHTADHGVAQLDDSDDAEIETLLARIALAQGRTQDGLRRMDQSLLTLRKLYDADPQDIGASSTYAYAIYDFAVSPKVPTDRRILLYEQMEEVARKYSAAHPRVLSAVLLQGQCALGLAQLKHDRTEAARAIALLQPVAAQRPGLAAAKDSLDAAKALLN